MTNDLMKVTRMTVYSGEYKTVRKNGITSWVKVVMHVSPIVKDPIDGSTYVNYAIDCVVTYWISDLAVAEVITVAKEHGEKFTDKDSKSSGYILEEQYIPRAYKYAFTEMGMQLHWERVNFETKRFKVDSNGKPIRSNGKIVSADGITVTYWTGGLADNTGVNLSREYCMKHALNEWREILLPTLDDEKDEKGDEDNKDENTGD